MLQMGLQLFLVIFAIFEHNEKQVYRWADHLCVSGSVTMPLAAHIAEFTFSIFKRISK